jgi:hypothetical protein
LSLADAVAQPLGERHEESLPFASAWLRRIGSR